MKYLVMFAGALGILTYVTIAQAEVICTRYGGCWETGKRNLSYWREYDPRTTNHQP